jgi:hypothetical protein
MPKRTKEVPPPARPAFAEPHEDSPTLAEVKAVTEHMDAADAKEGKKRGPMFDGPADAADFWRCATDGQRNKGARCTTCGAVKP